MRSCCLALLAGAAVTVTVHAQEHGHDHRHDPDAAVHSHRGPGPHFIDAFVTENAYLERKIRPDLFFASGDDADVLTAQLEVEWALRRSVSLIVHAPFLYIDPADGPSRSGPGDASVGIKIAPVNDRGRFILATGVDVSIPTGDAGRGLGEEHGAAEPFLLAWVPFGPQRRWLLQLGTHLEIPFESGADRHAESSVAVSWTSPLGLSPILEGIVEYGVEGKDPAYAVAPELRYEFAPGWEAGAGALVPVRGPREADVTLMVGVIRHFAMPWD
jgi:hypothetical protein